MSEEFTTQEIRQVLDLELGPNDSGKPTVRAYLIELLRKVWDEGEGFDGKRPFGNSSWDYDFVPAMVRAGIINGKLDEDGYVEHADDRRLNALVLAAIHALDVPRETAAAQPAKVIIVTELNGKERRYVGDDWSMNDENGSLLVLNGTMDGQETLCARYAAGAWLSVRRDGASTGDPYFTQGKKLALALDALREISRCTDVNFAIERAEDALAQIADVDL